MKGSRIKLFSYLYTTVKYFVFHTHEGFNQFQTKIIIMFFLFLHLIVIIT